MDLAVQDEFGREREERAEAVETEGAQHVEAPLPHRPVRNDVGRVRAIAHATIGGHGRQDDVRHRARPKRVLFFRRHAHVDDSLAVRLR